MNYTPAEDIKDVLQIILAVLARPCINKGHARSNVNRATSIAYAELQSMKKRLEHALAVMNTDEPTPEEMKRRNQLVVDAMAQVRESNRRNFPRPMGVPMEQPLDVGDGRWTVENRVLNAPDGNRPWELKHGEGHVGWFATFADAVNEANNVERGE